MAAKLTFPYRLSAVCIICALGILVYSNTLHNSFHFDDTVFIVNNPHITHFSGPAALWHYSPTRFVSFLSLAWNYQFSRLDVYGYHLFNLAVHLGVSLLVWQLVLLTLTTPALKHNPLAAHAHLIAFFSGLLFVAHPLQTQAVTYIAQRTASMAALFYLASLVFYIRSRIACDEGQGSGMGKLYYACSLGTALLAMFTKENACTLPLTIVLYEFYFFRTRKGFNLRFLIPFLATALITPCVMLAAHTFQGNLAQIRSASVLPHAMSAWVYFLTQLRVKLTYLRLLFLPFNQNLDYDYPIAQSLFDVPVVASLLVLGLILIAAVGLFHKYRLLSFAILWFFVTLLVESGVVPIADVIFEHRLYLPMVGYCIFLPVALYYLLGQARLKTLTVVLLIIVSCYAFLAYRRNFVWKDDFTLWADALRKSPRKARPYQNLAAAYHDAYEHGAIKDKEVLGKVIFYYTQAIAINPRYAKAYFSRGSAYLDRGTIDQAIADFSQAIQIKPSYADAYNGRGVAFRRKGAFAKAILDYSAAIAITPDYASAYNNRAVAYFFAGEYGRSWQDMRKAQGLGYPVDPEFRSALRGAQAIRE